MLPVNIQSIFPSKTLEVKNVDLTITKKAGLLSVSLFPLRWYGHKPGDTSLRTEGEVSEGERGEGGHVTCKLSLMMDFFVDRKWNKQSISPLQTFVAIAVQLKYFTWFVS